MPSASELMQIYNTLPPEGQQALVQNHLSTLLSSLSHKHSSDVLTAAQRLQTRYKAAPKLDLRKKEKELKYLFHEISRDAKTAFVQERSQREELLAEALHTLTSWLSTIWTVVYEHNVHFSLAHRCLMWVATSVVQVTEGATLGGCRCTLMNIPVEVTLKNREGKILKDHSVFGPQNVDTILYWIWRDLFVSFAATGLEKDKADVPQMLEEMEGIMGQDAMERLLYGGRLGATGLFDDENGAFSEDCECLHSTSEDGDSEDDEESECTCGLHAPYWSPKVKAACRQLRQHAEDRLLHSFEIYPTPRIYNTLMAISLDPDETGCQLEEIIDDVAGNSADNLVAALDIYIDNFDIDKVGPLIQDHHHLLRPRDSGTLSTAIEVLLSEPEFQARGFSILNKELRESITSIHAAVRNSFAYIEDERHQKELEEILKLKSGTEARRLRVEEWVDGIITESNMHPFAFAAVMMGLPLPPGSGDDDEVELLNHVNFDQDDPDLDDLREEFRPPLRARFESWMKVAQGLNHGRVLLMKIYTEFVPKMPWMRASDVISEMVNKLEARPNKSHVVEALQALSAFSKTQRKKINAVAAERKKKLSASASSKKTTSSSKTAVPSGSSSSTAPAQTSVPPHTCTSKCSGAAAPGSTSRDAPKASGSSLGGNQQSGSSRSGSTLNPLASVFSPLAPTVPPNSAPFGIPVNVPPPAGSCLSSHPPFGPLTPGFKTNVDGSAVTYDLEIDCDDDDSLPPPLLPPKPSPSHSSGSNAGPSSQAAKSPNGGTSASTSSKTAKDGAASSSSKLKSTNANATAGPSRTAGKTSGPSLDPSASVAASKTKPATTLLGSYPPPPPAPGQRVLGPPLPPGFRRHNEPVPPSPVTSHGALPGPFSSFGINPEDVPRNPTTGQPLTPIHLDFSFPFFFGQHNHDEIPDPPSPPPISPYLRGFNARANANANTNLDDDLNDLD